MKKEKNMQEKILNNNKKIDTNLLAEHKKLEENLRRLGIEIKPEYKIIHPLGSMKLKSQI